MKNNKDSKESKEFIDRKFAEVKDGYYDDFDFYHTPNGSIYS